MDPAVRTREEQRDWLTFLHHSVLKRQTHFCGTPSQNKSKHQEAILLSQEGTELFFPPFLKKAEESLVSVCQRKCVFIVAVFKHITCTTQSKTPAISILPHSICERGNLRCCWHVGIQFWIPNPNNVTDRFKDVATCNGLKHKQDVQTLIFRAQSCPNLYYIQRCSLKVLLITGGDDSTAPYKGANLPVLTWLLTSSLYSHKRLLYFPLAAQVWAPFFTCYWCFHQYLPSTASTTFPVTLSVELSVFS